MARGLLRAAEQVPLYVGDLLEVRDAGAPNRARRNLEQGS